MSLVMTLPIIPKPQMRARHGRTKGGFSVTYKAPEQQQAEENLCALLLPYRPRLHMEGPLKLIVAAYLPIPRSWPYKRQVAASHGLERPTGRPDLDNLMKHLKDCLTQTCFWQDDKQVVALEAAKYYGFSPKWIVYLEALNDD